MPSFILIHPTVWSQYNDVTDRTDRETDRTDNGVIVVVVVAAAAAASAVVVVEMDII